MMNILKSEFYKLKHTWVPWAHFILPVLYALFFYGAATMTSLKNFSDMDVFLSHIAFEYHPKVFPQKMQQFLYSSGHHYLFLPFQSLRQSNIFAIKVY